MPQATAGSPLVDGGGPCTLAGRLLVLETQAPPSCPFFRWGEPFLIFPDVRGCSAGQTEPQGRVSCSVLSCLSLPTLHLTLSVLTGASEWLVNMEERQKIRKSENRPYAGCGCPGPFPCNWGGGRGASWSEVRWQLLLPPGTAASQTDSRSLAGVNPRLQWAGPSGTPRSQGLHVLGSRFTCTDHCRARAQVTGAAPRPGAH